MVKICAIFGHNDITLYKDKNIIYNSLENLIQFYGIKIFLLGSRSILYDICLEILTELKLKYPFFKIAYIMAEFEDANERYKKEDFMNKRKFNKINKLNEKISIGKKYVETLKVTWILFNNKFKIISMKLKS